MKQLWISTIIICITILAISGCQKTTESINIDNTLVAAQVSPDPNAAPPVIVFEETEIDFGQVGPGTSLEKEIRFMNSGEGILEITQIGLCCGVMASTDKIKYEPNEIGILKIEFVAPGEIGIFEREPIVYSNDPVNPKVGLPLYCDVVQKVVWRPEKFKLLLNEENAACPDLNIYCIDGEEFAITGFRSTGNCITAEYNPTVKKTEHVLKLKVDMDKLPEQLYGEINVTMNHPSGNIATIFFDVVPRYTLSPKPMYMFHMKSNEPKNGTIKIINNYKDDFEIESTSSKNGYVKLISSEKDEFDYVLEVEVTPPPSKDDTVKFTDIFYINLKNGEQLAINCTGYYD